MTVALTLGASLGNYLGAWVYDLQGSYAGAMGQACVTALLASLVV